MKKMRNGKRGFTLLEIVTVVAIIVIIAGAAVVGVTVTLQRASATKAYLEANNGRNFESEARNTVKNLTVNTVDWSPIPKYTPQNLAKKKWDELLAFGWTEEELGGELKYRDNGWYIEALEGDPSDAWDPAKHNGLTLDQYTEMKNTVNSYLMAGYTMDEIGLTYGGPEGFSINPQWNPGLHNGKPVPGTVITPDPTQAPEPSKAPTNTPDPTRAPDPTDTPVSTPVPSQNPSSGGSTMSLHNSNQYNRQSQNNTFTGNGSPVKSITVTISDGATFKSVSNTDNGGRYKFKMNDDNTSFTITFDESLGWASPDTKINVGDIQWYGGADVELTYEFVYG